ncbi:LOW QUALITY PROTEIN: hypothetical protein HID58_094810 [Brassica napus]|uniref:Early light-induced protein n=1 Tax=Brassica napus TaxID=3708 RepID=A0ABQ7X8D7_BRANA|nr:LOW QUALITY PROTEIN: hypothetical protein HID58_094810 [Brassica napus]
MKGKKKLKKVQETNSTYHSSSTHPINTYADPSLHHIKLLTIQLKILLYFTQTLKLQKNGNGVVNMQSVFAGGLTTRKINTNKLCFAGNFHNLKRNYPVGVRCMAEGEPMKDESAPFDLGVSAFAQVIVATTTSSSYSNLSGPAPERINGRLAMVGFVAALAVELSKGENLRSPTVVSRGSSVRAAILTLASLVPLFKGITAESKSKGLMTSDAELWNGRFAMLGLVALAFTEFVKVGLSFEKEEIVYYKICP